MALFNQNAKKTLWILIRWLRLKPADKDLQCSENRIYPGSARQGLIWFHHVDEKHVEPDQPLRASFSGSTLFSKKYIEVLKGLAHSVLVSKYV